jgi:hypothetical protein
MVDFTKLYATSEKNWPTVFGEKIAVQFRQQNVEAQIRPKFAICCCSPKKIPLNLFPQKLLAKMLIKLTSVVVNYDNKIFYTSIEKKTKTRIAYLTEYFFCNSVCFVFLL